MLMLNNHFNSGRVGSGRVESRVGFKVGSSSESGRSWVGSGLSMFGSVSSRVRFGSGSVSGSGYE